MTSPRDTEREDPASSDPDLACTAPVAPPVEGPSYRATVPDTLDLADRAGLAIHAITRMLDPGRDYLMHTEVRFNRIPAVLRFTGNGSITCAGKHLEACPCCGP